MIEKVVEKGGLRNGNETARNREYGLSRPPAERAEAVELLRKQRDGNTARLRRIARVIQR